MLKTHGEQQARFKTGKCVDISREQDLRILKLEGRNR